MTTLITRFEEEIIDSIERMSLFDLNELDILENLPVLPMYGGYQIVEDLEEYENEIK